MADRDWVARLYPGAAEATVYRRRPRARSRTRTGAALGSAIGRDRAVRRARAESRRYVVHNRLAGHHTLTFRDAKEDADDVRAAVQGLIRRVRRRVGPFPFLFVLERHGSGALHVHLLTPSSLRWLVRSAWTLGMIRTRRHSSMPEALRLLASYVMKATRERPTRHAYEVGRGFQPRRVELRAASARDLVDALTRLMGNVRARFDRRDNGVLLGSCLLWARRVDFDRAVPAALGYLGRAAAPLSGSYAGLDSRHGLGRLSMAGSIEARGLTDG